ncbi:MAG: methyl-accepting chemotaxis protein [Francisellaceae bacterium]|jgi:methyl-accepting chemotaxis protein|nr:methyl-accepting chemotaxis protein [Francisellaceae bacterium]MBT6208346.1 methyl-accepting chemotaxis protein [Francisellaceae bacterium]
MSIKNRLLYSFITKINIAFACIVTVILSIFGVYNHTLLKESMMADLDVKAENIGGRLSESLLEPLWNLDEDVYLKIIKSELSTKTVPAIKLISSSDELVSSLSINNKDEIINLKDDDTTKLPYYSYEKVKNLKYDVYGEEENLGKVILYVSDHHVQQQLKLLLYRQVIQIIILDVILAVFQIIILNVVISQPLSKLNKALSNIAERGGDLRRRLQVNSKDELGVIAKTFNLFIHGLQEIIKKAKMCSRELYKIAEDSATNTTQIYEDIDREKQEISSLATAVTEMSASARLVAENAKRASTYTKNAHSESSNGKKVVDLTIHKINDLVVNVEDTATFIEEITNRTDQIEFILGTIREISQQTNLLALNAAIEAARAGDAGRGFSIVADEVRSLSLRTNQATEEIHGMIKSFKDDTQKSIDVMESSHQKAQSCVEQVTEAGESLEKISSSVEKILDMSTYIANAADEQYHVSSEIDRNISNINVLINNTHNITKNSAQGAERAKITAQTLKDLMDNFRV